MRKSLAVFLLVACAAIAPLDRLFPIRHDGLVPRRQSRQCRRPRDRLAIRCRGLFVQHRHVRRHGQPVRRVPQLQRPHRRNVLGIYNPNMSNATFGGVSYNPAGTVGSLYGVLPGDDNNPINYVTFYDAIRFANWMNNGQAPGGTETGLTRCSAARQRPAMPTASRATRTRLSFFPAKMSGTRRRITIQPLARTTSTPPPATRRPPQAAPRRRPIRQTITLAARVI